MPRGEPSRNARRSSSDSSGLSDAFGVWAQVLEHTASRSDPAAAREAILKANRAAVSAREVRAYRAEYARLAERFRNPFYILDDLSDDDVRAMIIQDRSPDPFEALMYRECCAAADGEDAGVESYPLPESPEDEQE